MSVCSRTLWTAIEYRFATRDDAEALALLFEDAFNESGFPSRGIQLFGARKLKPG